MKSIIMEKLVSSEVLKLIQSLVLPLELKINSLIDMVRLLETKIDKLQQFDCSKEQLSTEGRPAASKRPKGPSEKPLTTATDIVQPIIEAEPVMTRRQRARVAADNVPLQMKRCAEQRDSTKSAVLSSSKPESSLPSDKDDTVLHDEQNGQWIVQQRRRKYRRAVIRGTEGFLTTCSFDYISEDQDTKVFVACIFVWSYCIPMSLICYFYSQLFVAVRHHEKMLKDQAKKMNVKSLASNKDDAGKSVEIRIAKVAFTIFFLFVCAWTPYAFVTMTGAFGDKSILTPVATMVPSLCAKIVSCVDPWVYAINHPRYRAELEKRVPWMGVREPNPDTVSSNASTGTSVATAPSEA